MSLSTAFVYFLRFSHLDVIVDCFCIFGDLKDLEVFSFMCRSRLSNTVVIYDSTNVDISAQVSKLILRNRIDFRGFLLLTRSREESIMCRANEAGHRCTHVA